MRELSQHETSMVSAGEMTCAIGDKPVACPGAADYSRSAEWLVGALTDLMEKLADWWNN